MENHLKHNLAWKLAVPLIAVLLVIGIVIYNGGLENALKFMGIKASELQTINLTTTQQFEGNSPEDKWLVQGSFSEANGASALEGYTGIPEDPAEAGLIMPIYSSEDPSENVYLDHTYISPALDLEGETPTLSSYAVTAYAPEGTSLIHSYRTAGTVDALQTAQFIPVELSQDNGESEVSTFSTELGITTERYIQIKVEFINNTFGMRSAVYSWNLQYNANLADEVVVTDPIQMPTDGTIPTPTPVTLDFMEAGELPDTISIQVLNTTLGVQPFIEESNVATDEAAPLYSLKDPLLTGTYVLVIRSAGYEALVVPFTVTDTPTTIKLPTFAALPQKVPTFDLNGDGVVNSLDVALLLTKVGTTVPQTGEEALTEE